MLKKEKTPKYTILVVEDELPLQQAIQLKLEKNDLGVVTARSVTQARTLIDELSKVDAIWLDHYLIGKESGLDFVAEVKNNPKLKRIPIFVVSNTASADKVKTYLELGVNKYFTKSNYRLEQIITEIKKAI